MTGSQPSLPSIISCLWAVDPIGMNLERTEPIYVQLAKRFLLQPEGHFELRRQPLTSSGLDGYILPRFKPESLEQKGQIFTSSG